MMMMMMMIFDLLTCLALFSSSVLGHTGGPSFFLYPNNEITLASPFPVDQFLPLFKRYGEVFVEKTAIVLGKKSSPNQNGALWSKRTMSEENWQVNFAFRIKGDTIGGNGLAFWYTRDGHRTGSVYGAPDKFDGLGLAFDTFDEETKAESVPMVVGMLGNGNTTFRQGSVPNSANSFVIGSCFKSVRNTENPVFVRITYFRRHLKVEIDHAKEGSNYITCFERRSIDLPIGYYMGITASTNNYPDVYEIYSLKTGIFTTVSRNADLNELKDKMTENEIFKDDSSVAQIFSGVKQIQEKQQEMMAHIRGVLGNPASDLLPLSGRMETLERDIRHLDNHLDRTEESLHAMTILLKKLIKDTSAKAVAGNGSFWAENRAVLVMLAGQACLLGLYLLLKRPGNTVQRKAL